MGQGETLWQARRLVLFPTASRREYALEVKDEAGSTLATCDGEGTVRDQSGEVLLAAPLRWDGRDDKPTNARVEIADAGGQPLGTGRVCAYGVGPRARKATVEVGDAQGGPALRLEPQDRRGDELVVTADGSELATLSVEQVKAGFLRKSRVYTVDIGDGLPEPVRKLVVAAAVRYDGLLNAVVAAAAHDRD